MEFINFKGCWVESKNNTKKIMSKIACFGEVLWDVFPTHKKIGGAPLNVALRLHSFTNNVAIISSVGNDDEGLEIINYIKEQGLSVDFIQKNTDYNTSNVKVLLDDKGAASYTIKQPCAWDYIENNNAIKEVVTNSDAFIFGSLVARNNTSKETLVNLLSSANFTIFDVNLRPPHYQLNVLTEFMQKASFIKFNDDELFEINQSLGYKNQSLKENIQYIAKHTNTNKICVTRGANGAILFYENQFYENNGYAIKVADTVGSGDSFLATLIHHLLKKTNPQIAINTACAVGALVAKNQGANPKISSEDIKKIMTL